MNLFSNVKHLLLFYSLNLFSNQFLLNSLNIMVYFKLWESNCSHCAPCRMTQFTQGKQMVLHITDMAVIGTVLKGLSH